MDDTQMKTEEGVQHNVSASLPPATPSSQPHKRKKKILSTPGRKNIATTFSEPVKVF